MLLATMVNNGCSVAKSVAHPPVLSWTAFYMFFNIKSWQLHLILFMKMLSHVFLLKVFMSRKCCVLYLIECSWYSNVYDLVTFYFQVHVKQVGSDCHTNHSVCLKPAAVKERPQIRILK